MTSFLQQKRTEWQLAYAAHDYEKCKRIEAAVMGRKPAYSESTIHDWLSAIEKWWKAYKWANC